MRLLLIIVFSICLCHARAQQNDTTRQMGPNGLEYIQVNNAKGELMFTGSYHNGIKEGTFINYWTETGYPKTVEIYYNDKKNGTSLNIDVTGYTTLVEPYKNDMLDGPRRMFTKGAFISEEAYYKN